MSIQHFFLLLAWCSVTNASDFLFLLGCKKSHGLINVSNSLVVNKNSQKALQNSGKIRKKNYETIFPSAYIVRQ
jgi:hypothetical protein